MTKIISNTLSIEMRSPLKLYCIWDHGTNFDRFSEGTCIRYVVSL